MRARNTALLIAIACGAACGDGGGPAPRASAPAVPWQRTEAREACAAFEPLRQPFFGDLHVHTRYSADAAIYGTKAGPRDAYDFARGAEILVSDADEQPTRPVRLARALDFTAVTDHAEFFGEVDLCTRTGSAVYDLRLCQILRQFEPPARQFATIVQWLFPAGIDNPPPSHTFCTTPGVDCDAAAVSVWSEMQAAAEEAYDRTAACTFTSFVGYEHTPSRGGRHQHRNVIFRNHHVPPFAYSQLETAAGGVPQGLWSAIETHCLDAGTGCDAVLIPHNSNLSDGLQFFDPADGAEAQRRQDREPLVEIFQAKGGSECRFDRLAGAGVGTADELCTFEQLPEAAEVPGQAPPPIDAYPARNLVRNALRDGLRFEATLGANPFRFGFVGSTDTHNANPGDTDEARPTGVQGNHDATPERQIGAALSGNAGGLTGIWAEENSRDALFAALRRRETFATSGSRPVVRFFAGRLDGVACGAADFVARAYATGTPMGGELGAVRGARSPRFAVLALKDPGSADAAGVDLQRLQIIKGWLDADGVTHEAVYDVAGDADPSAGVDAACAPTGGGAAELCAVWEDPDFDPAAPAFYYARVLEQPSCRWSTVVCQQAGVDPLAADCAAQATAADPAFADCCLTAENQPFLSPLIQERAWSSPIWYRREAIAAVEGALQLGAAGRVELAIRLATLPADAPSNELWIELRGADTLLQRQPDAVTIAGNGEVLLQLAADGIALDLARRDQFLTVRVASRAFRSESTRRWHYATGRLTPVTP